MDNINNEKKKVAIVIANSIRALDDFGNRPEKEARFLVEKGFGVKVFILQNKVFGKETIENQINGIDAVHFVGHSEKEREKAKATGRLGKNRLYYFGLGFRFIFWLRKQLRKERFDYIQCHNLQAMLAGYLAKEKGTKLIFVVRENYVGKGNKPLITRVFLKVLTDFLLWAAYRVEYVGPAQYEGWSEKIKAKAVYIPNYPERHYFPDTEKTESDIIRINYVGNPRDKVSLSMLLEACKDVPGVRAAIYGRFNNEALGKELEEKHPEAYFYGEYRHKDSGWIYSQTDILYVSGNPRVLNFFHARAIKLYEAIITKTPIIMPIEKDAYQLIKENNFGWGYSFYEESGLKDLIRHISENRNEIMEKEKSIEARQYDFTWESIVGELEKVFV